MSNNNPTEKHERPTLPQLPRPRAGDTLRTWLQPWADEMNKAIADLDAWIDERVPRA